MGDVSAAMVLVLILLLRSALCATQQACMDMDDTKFNNTSLIKANKTNDVGGLQDLGDGLKGRMIGSKGLVHIRSRQLSFALFFLCIASDCNRYTLSLLGFSASSFPANNSAKVLWSAQTVNNQPFADNSYLGLGSDGNLILYDADETILWVTGTTISNGTNQVCINDRGVLLIKNNQTEENPMWESDTHSSDTILEESALVKYLTSSVSELDNSPGKFSLQVKSEALVLYYNSDSDGRLCYASWPIHTTSPSPSLYLFSTVDTSQSSSLYSTVYTNISRCNTHASRYANISCNTNGTNSVMSLAIWCGNQSCPNGIIKTFSYDNKLVLFKILKLTALGDLRAYGFHSSGYWLDLGSVFANRTCDLPTICGSYGLCQNNRCMDNCNSSSCTNTSVNPLSSSCGRNSIMKWISKVDYFATRYAEPIGGNISSPTSCSQACSINCSCNAAFFHAKDKACFHFQEVGTLQSVSNDTFEAFLKSGIAPIRRSKSNHLVKPIVGATCAIILLLLLCIILAIYKIKSNKEAEEEALILKQSQSGAKLPQFSYKQLKKFTGRFQQKLGEGGFGNVYRAKLPNNTAAAVKMLDGSNQGSKEFLAEVTILSKIHHWNLVQLLAYCIEGKRRALIYAYMVKGSLDTWLFGDAPAAQLTWPIRLKIAIGTAKGLAYLHEECQERIAHLDIKPQNILLDENFVPKLSDFGLSRLISRDQSMVMTTMRGTRGYLAPEWLAEGAITVKSDVYSFGVVLVEIVCGFRARGLQAWALWKAAESKSTVTEFVDPRLKNEFDFEEAKRMIKIAGLCMQHDPDIRPCMSGVVQMLEGKASVEELMAPDAYSAEDARHKFMQLLEVRSMSISNAYYNSTEESAGFSAAPESAGSSVTDNVVSR